MKAPRLARLATISPAARPSSASPFRLKRVYDPPSAEDGTRILIERLWPRGMKKEALRCDAWVKEAGPSHQLRRWFHHDPERWDEFRRRYAAELRHNAEALRPLLESAARGPVTLLYSSRDQLHNNAVALKAFLEAVPAARRRA